MRIDEKTKRWLAWATIVASIVAVRVSFVIYERNRPYYPRTGQRQQIPPDYQITVPKFYIEDYQGAQILNGKPLWVKYGYSMTYFPCQVPSGKDSHKQPLVFLPMEKIVVRQVIERPSALKDKSKEVLVQFQKNGKCCETRIGLYNSDERRYLMQLDELFYPKDPREIYTHWTSEMWQAIERHDINENMTIHQVFLSLGYGRLVNMEAGGVQLYEFGRKPGGLTGITRVRFYEGRVKEIRVVG